MNDQERITDLIFAEKKMSSNYDTFASECVNVQLRDEYLNILNQGHKTQTELFKTAQQKGWYQVEQAPMDKINQAKTKYTSSMPQ